MVFFLHNKGELSPQTYVNHETAMHEYIPQLYEHNKPPTNKDRSTRSIKETLIFKMI